ncbi:protein kinase family protein [Nocardioides panacisoli]|uniref:non-specific serine/threonine protein kinase n=1 Tax=Nocardioides panacisoli TaxID=627624 RepID=A0ABP7J2Q4_9ACTN
MATSTRPGDLLAGRYRLVDLLSESAGGRFWRAHDLVLERPVALHVIAEDDPRSDALIEAAGASAQVLDARILRVLDADHRDGLCYVVNEWGNGISLDILVLQAGPLGPRRAAWLVADVAAAIARAHQAGVAHGRLNPENVLIDRFGSVRLIGLCVDAALHGIRTRDEETDRADLAGLLYCALTATWPGPSDSIVPAAPVAHGEVLAPRRVRAGVPRALDQLWCEVVTSGDRRRHGNGAPDLSSAAAISQALTDFLGDTTGLPEALAASIPPINDVQPVNLPSVADPVPHDYPDPTVQVVAREEPAVLEEPEPEPEPATQPVDRLDELGGEDADDPPIPSVSDLPTEAGMPVFGEDDQVEWLRARSTPPPPPPPFEDPPERPLFSPDNVRRPRPDVPQPPAPPPPASPRPVAATGFWPWDAEAAAGLRNGDGDGTSEIDTVPGRSWLRLAIGIAAALLLLMGVVVAFNLGRGRTPLGFATDEPTPTPSTSAPASPAAPHHLTGLTATAFDPYDSKREEHDEEAANAVDGNPQTTWATYTYYDQFGPGGLKPGVGLVVDLGRSTEIASVDLALAGSPTSVSLYVYDAGPTKAPTGAPVAKGRSTGDRLTLTPAHAVTGRYALVWITSLPPVSGGGFRGEIAEVTVDGR